MVLSSRQNACLSLCLLAAALFGVMVGDLSILTVAIIVGVGLRVTSMLVNLAWYGTFGERLIED